LFVASYVVKPTDFYTGLYFSIIPHYVKFSNTLFLAKPRKTRAIKIAPTFVFVYYTKNGRTLRPEVNPDY